MLRVDTTSIARPRCEVLCPVPLYITNDPTVTDTFRLWRYILVRNDAGQIFDCSHAIVGGISLAIVHGIDEKERLLVRLMHESPLSVWWREIAPSSQNR